VTCFVEEGFDLNDSFGKPCNPPRATTLKINGEQKLADKELGTAG
jgi:hypothetical protein